jgi:tellurite methyltransferase
VDRSRSIGFFDAQFRRQVESREFILNPFEARALPFLGGRVLDLGCGMGNLAVAAATKGARVLALDGSPAAIGNLTDRARASGLDITARCEELSDYEPPGEFDCVVSIGLFMFLPPAAAYRQLERALRAVLPGGIAAVNVLIEGTTYTEMFDTERGYTLFREDDLPRAFAGWEILDDRVERFDAPGGTAKRFRTTIARRPGATRSSGRDRARTPPEHLPAAACRA